MSWKFHQNEKINYDFRVKAVSIYVLICYRIPKDIAQLNITTDKVPRQDTLFMKKVWDL